MESWCSCPPDLVGLGGYWAPQLTVLTQSYRVAIYDHRGTGRSERTIPTPYSATNLADDLRLILDGLGADRAHIVGHAAGGIAGLELARLHFDRVQSLTVVNGWAVADPHFKRCFEIRRAIYQSGGAKAYLKAQPLFLFPAEWISDHLDELDEQAKHHAPGFQDEATLFSRMDALAAFDIRTALPTITCPVLVISSNDDMLVPARSSSVLADGLPNTTLIQMNWGGHAMNISAAEDFNRHLVKFLASFNGEPQA